jgi:hypothetical protein
MLLKFLNIIKCIISICNKNFLQGVRKFPAKIICENFLAAVLLALPDIFQHCPKRRRSPCIFQVVASLLTEVLSLLAQTLRENG